MHEQHLISDKEYGDIKYQAELAHNQYESALLRYQYTQIRAPFDGVVTERLVDRGENIAVGTRLYVIADTDPLLLTMYLPEAEIKSIREGQVVFINPDVNPELNLQGSIIRIAPEVDQRTGTVKVTAKTGGDGIPGSFVRVRIVTDTRPSTLAVPRRAVVSDAGERYVFVAEADTVRQAGVTVGYEDEEYAEVLTGIAPGDSVVTAGAGGIRTGTKVKVLSREESSRESGDETRGDSIVSKADED
jgi:RND family efflux transporter MFP subunit